jgi:hypothetical protein
VIALREPLLRPDGGNVNWENVQSVLKRNFTNPEVRASVTTFYETFSKKKDSEYRLNPTQFEKFSQLMNYMITLMEEEKDYTNLARLVYFTQYFCMIQQTMTEGQDIGDVRAIWIAATYLQMEFIKQSKFWEQSFCWLLHEALFEQRNQEPWRLFVNIYYRNLPVLCRVVADAAQRADILKQVLLRCDLEETPELMKKLEDLGKLPIDQIEVNFAIKRAFVKVLLIIG